MMRTVSKLVIVVIVVVVGTVFVAGPAFAETDAVSSANSGTATRNLYLSNCARCHGADGQGDTESGRLYDVPDISGGRLRRKSSAKLTTVVMRGGKSMPAFSKKLTRKQIASIVGYIRGL